MKTGQYKLAEIPELTGYSNMNTFRRNFQQITGISPSKYLKSQRLNYAKQLLTETDLDYDSIAQKIGYTSYSHFWVAFQKSLGTSPNDYRKHIEEQ